MTARHAEIARKKVVDDQTLLATDKEGLIEFHDGSVTDYFWRRGAKWAAAVESTVETPMVACHRIHLAWIRGFIDLVAQT
jgi:glucose-6-phosphate dehydrogenase assembly protein OpcA